ncbi:hypothetical protein KC19_3G209200 [Ceratodon purpureus]|uniref:Uncharacterized protein n=1 Tax=Ceratodon purpureus TaxID=3225 RepID=A0A8T0INM9_CERPU|nr:hypothetical protein KC19_3G209200 [Ceratodon purpureus]
MFESRVLVVGVNPLVVASLLGVATDVATDVAGTAAVEVELIRGCDSVLQNLLTGFEDCSLNLGTVVTIRLLDSTNMAEGEIPDVIARGGAAMHAAPDGAPSHPNNAGGAPVLADPNGPAAPHPKRAGGGAAMIPGRRRAGPPPNIRGGAAMHIAGAGAPPHQAHRNAGGVAVALAGPALPPGQQYFDVDGGLEGPRLGRNSLIFFAGPALPPVQQYFDVDSGLEGRRLGRNSLIFF